MTPQLTALIPQIGMCQDPGVASWRDEASPLVQDDIDRLLRDATRLAQFEVGKRGSFSPFAVVIEAGGELRPMALETGRERLDSAEVLGILWRGLHEMREDLRASALCVDVRLPTRGTDAVQIYLEHREGLSIKMMMPYAKGRFGRKARYGEIEEGTTDPRVWLLDDS